LGTLTINQDITMPQTASRTATIRKGTARRRSWWSASLVAMAFGAASSGAQAQAIVMAGSYQNFDVLNSTGAPTYGFEMEVRGVSASQVSRIFPSNFNAGVIRYGFGSARDFPGGVLIRWAATYDPATGLYSTSTPVPPSLTTVPGDSCWTLGMPKTYATAGCEHFGISASANPTSIVYRWLVPDPSNPGILMSTPGSVVDMAAPNWAALPPANPALPPVVVAVIPAPPPPPAQFGTAQWVRVYKVEHADKVNLDELVGDNHAIVPENAAQLETNWSLLQADPPGGGQRKRGKLANQGNAGNGNHAVVRRYEFYKYAGAYDALTHEALCADLTCTAPSPGELGDAIGAQNAAANLDINALTVTIGGSGNVSSSDKVFSCGSKCYGVYIPGSTVTLTAKPGSGSTFSGWSGACIGNAATCTVTLNAESAVTATFATVVAGGGGGGGGGGGATGFKLTVAKSNSGTVTSTPAGINCGNSCLTSYGAGNAVTLTATPPPGLAFLGWSGACSGALATCTVTMNADTKVQASFAK
jgi:hypothetical protein